MAAMTVVPLDLPQTDPNASDQEEESDESAPLSPTPQNSKSYGVASPVVGPAATATTPHSQQGPKEEQGSIDDIDPFTFVPPLKFWHKLLIAFNALWLFPLRLFFVVLMTAMGTVIFLTSTWCERYDPQNPTPRAKWRRMFADIIAPKIDRMFLFGFGFHWITYKGRQATTEAAPILIAAPHSSLLDSFVVALFGIPSYVAKDNTRNITLFGPIVEKSMRAIFVRRDDPDSRMRAAEEIRRRASSGGRWAKVLIYPEGTTHNRKMVLSFKRGAFLPKLPVQPLLIKYQNKLGTTTWGRNGWNQLKGLFFTLCQFHNSLEIEFLDVYTPSEEEKADVGLYTKNVQALVAKHLKLPVGVQSVEDTLFMNLSLTLKLPFRTGLVLYNRLSKETGLRFVEVRSFLNRFAAIDVDKDGLIGPEDMAAFLSVPNDACLQALFSSTDKGAGERLTFKQYLYSFAGRAKPFLSDETFLKSVFDFFDRNKDGLVNMSDISRVLPVTKLPEIQPHPQVRRRKGRGDGDVEVFVNGGTQVPVSSEQEKEADMDFGQFKVMLEANPEYLLLFQECQNAGISSPSSPSATAAFATSPTPTSPAHRQQPVCTAPNHKSGTAAG